ncbi:hypothetical protein LCGC14_2610780 [marine sediment metagenome]|uniref:Uncharacterized protein n=1 Tax=marine sediment metagenome TaxID=412755 RepID=A0A0F9CGZ7_9ZZZZ
METDRDKHYQTLCEGYGDNCDNPCRYTNVDCPVNLWISQHPTEARELAGH